MWGLFTTFHCVFQSCCIGGDGRGGDDVWLVVMGGNGEGAGGDNDRSGGDMGWQVSRGGERCIDNGSYCGSGGQDGVSGPLCNTKTLSHGNKLRDLWPRLIITEAEVLWWLLHKEEKDGEWKLTRCQLMFVCLALRVR